MSAGKLRRGEGSVSRYTLADGSERWRVRWWDGEVQRSTSKDTEEEAIELALSVSTGKRLGRYIPVSRLTVQTACEQYLQRNADRWTGNTQASYSQVARSHIYPTIGKVLVSELATSRVQNWVDSLARKGMAASTINNARVILKGTYADLVRLGDMSRNPVVGVRVPKKKRTEKRVWSQDDVRRVLAVARVQSQQMEVLYRVAITTGMRPGEIRALKWSDVDLDAGVITCQRTVTRDKDFHQHIGETTKTGRVRSIAVPRQTVDALAALRQEQRLRRVASANWHNTNLVFDRGDGRMAAQETLRKRHERICEAAGVEAIRFHDMRHTAATLLLKAGVNVKIVSEILGHMEIATTMNIYQHVSIEMQRDATNLLGEIAE